MAIAVAVSGQNLMASIALVYGVSEFRRCMRAWFFTDQLYDASMFRKQASSSVSV
jgi:hypothetical protein